MARGYETTARGYESTSLTSMEICQDIMECNKNLATTYTTAALEAADPAIRRTFRQLGRDCERIAYRAFEILHTHGHYEVKGASPTECRQIEDMLASFLRGHAVPNAEEPRSPETWQRYETERAYASERRPVGYDTDRTFGTGATTYGSERTSPYGHVRSERTELPDWARSRT